MAEPEDEGLGGFAALCFAIYGAQHAFTRAYRPLLEPLGLTYPQYLAMAALWTRDGRTVGEIGRVLRLETGTLTPLLQRLEAAGLIRRDRAREDERVVRLRLTEAGRALAGRAASIPRCMAEAAGLGADDARHLADALDRLRERLEGGAGG